MKKITIICLATILSLCAYGHNVNYKNIDLRKWHLLNDGNSIEGSFYMIKDSNVYIENAENKIIELPLRSLSETDQEYIRNKHNHILELNEQLSIKRDYEHDSLPGIQTKIIFWVILLAGFSVFVWSKTYRDKRRYLLPVWITGVVFTLFSFTNGIMKAMKTITSPAFIDSAFTPFKPEIHTFWDTSYFYVESRGIPTTHTMMVGISNRGWQQQVPIPQCYIGSNAWPIPLNPELATTPIPVDSIHFTRGAIALAVNGIPIFNVHTNTGVDSYLDGQLDNFGGHCGRADDYHYHIAPLHLYQYTTATAPIAFGLDGYAIYGSKEPDGTSMQNLDANHGHLFNGVYHYHGTSTKPYMIAKMAGKVTEDNTHQLIPQPSAKPVRPSLTPLSGALITSCVPNSSNNGYSLTYTRNNLTDSVVYSWTTTGQYTFKYYTNGNLDSTKNYNGFLQCKVPVTTGLHKLYKDIEISLYPNPSKGNFHLQISNLINQEVIKYIFIYNVKGEVVYQSEKYQTNLELSNLPKGIYFMRLRLEDGEIVKKVIIE